VNEFFDRNYSLPKVCDGATNLNCRVKFQILLASLRKKAPTWRRKMHYNYRTKGTCAQVINFDIEDGIVKNVEFTGGCEGNLKAIPRLIEGCPAEEVATKLRGVTCGGRSTSCADQLATALLGAVEEDKN